MRMILDIRQRMVGFKRAVLRPTDRLVGRGRHSAALTGAFIATAALFAAAPNTHAAEGEIRIGNTMPYSGPASAYGVIGKTITAVFRKINAEGGIRGRRINFISYDDSYN